MSDNKKHKTSTVKKNGDKFDVRFLLKLKWS